MLQTPRRPRVPPWTLQSLCLNWGAQNWSQFCRCGHSRAEQRGRMNLPDLLLKLFLMPPRYHQPSWPTLYPLPRGHKGFSPRPDTLFQSRPSGSCHSAFSHVCLELSQPVTTKATARRIPPPGKAAKTLRSPVATSPLFHSGINSHAPSQTPSAWATTSPSRAASGATMLTGQS